MIKKLFTYENGIVFLLSLIFGCLFFDRLALNFLMPYVSKDLNLNNTHIGLLAGALSLCWAFSSFFTTAWAENKDKKKLIFVVAILLFSICSFGSGLALSFGILLLSRMVMGLAEGPVIPLAQNFVERVSSPNRLGLNAGILQAVGSALFGSILAPVILVKIADSVGWRNAFYVAGLPGLLLGILAWFALNKNTTQSNKMVSSDSSFNIQELLTYNNVRWGIPTAVCVMGWWFATLPFITNYFVQHQGMNEADMGKNMGLLGISGLLASMIVPGLSDKFGRKKILLIFCVIGALYPFAVYFLNGKGVHLPAMFITYFMMGAIPLVAAVIPSEAVPDLLKAKAIGLITGIAEIVGGVIVPGIAGVLSDKIAPSAFLWVASTLAVLAIFFASRLESKSSSSLAS
jgi:predicted MFS family arabinose efflux permease